MYYTDKKLQFPVTVEKPNPVFARMLQQATGGVEGEIRVCMQYLEKAPVSFQEEMAADPIAGAVMNGMDMRHILSTGLAAMPSDANGVPLNMSHIYASGNIAGICTATLPPKQRVACLQFVSTMRQMIRV